MTNSTTIRLHHILTRMISQHHTPSYVAAHPTEYAKHITGDASPSAILRIKRLANNHVFRETCTMFQAIPPPPPLPPTQHPLFKLMLTTLQAVSKGRATDATIRHTLNRIEEELQ